MFLVVGKAKNAGSWLWRLAAASFKRRRCSETQQPRLRAASVTLNFTRL